MAIDMRHTKLTASEAALLAGELKKPSWQSQNEGIHEKVSFEDSIWGFDLAGGSFYNTPLRVVYVKPDSRADKAGIRKGDKLTKINDIDTSTLTIQEAHEIIIESGIHLKIAVTAPEDEEDSYFCYEDPLQSGYDSDEERRKEEERERKRHVHAKVSSYWSLQWPWVSKRRIIYRESNCFMVPSKYESGHRDKFPIADSLKTPEEIILQSERNERLLKEKQMKELADAAQNSDDVLNNNDIPNGNGIPNGDLIPDRKALSNGDATPNGSAIPNGTEIPKNNKEQKLSSNTNAITENEKSEVNGTNPVAKKNNSFANGESEIEEPIVKNGGIEESIDNQTVVQNGDIGEELNTSNGNHDLNANSMALPEDDELIDEVLQSEETTSKTEEEMIIDSILSEGEPSVDEEATDER